MVIDPNETWGDFNYFNQARMEYHGYVAAVGLILLWFYGDFIGYEHDNHGHKLGYHLYNYGSRTNVFVELHLPINDNIPQPNA